MRTPKRSRAVVTGDIKSALRGHYLLDGSEYEDQVFESTIRLALEEQIELYELAARFNAILATQSLPDTRPTSQRTLNRLFARDLHARLISASLLSDDDEDEQIFFDEFGEDLDVHLCSFWTSVTWDTHKHIPRQPNGDPAQLSAEQVPELANFLTAQDGMLIV